MRKKIFVFTALIIGVGIFLFISLATPDQDKKKDDLYKKVSLFSDALAIIRAEYVDEINPHDLIYGSLRGMLASLDPYSQFMDPDTYNELKIDKEGKFGGLGIEITIADGLLTVVTPIEDTPAWKAGIKSKDRIVKINNELTRDMTLNEAVKKMRGKPGETVTLTVLRESQKKILEIKIVRDIIKIKDVKGARILEDNIGYIRIVEFRENTSSDLDVALENLKKQGINALILDLRNNPGGLLDSAVKVSEKFVQKGKLIVSTKGRKDYQNMEFISRTVKPLVDLPMAVLINEGSASGSEIVAACLQDYKLAIILGTKSFGKGVVQTIVPLNDGSALSLTTSRYFTPLGKVIHGKGVAPDVVVEEGRIELASQAVPLAESPKAILEEIENKEKPVDKSESQDYKTDNQLMRAVDVLKAVRIYKTVK